MPNRKGGQRLWRKVKIAPDWHYSFVENDAAYNLEDTDPDLPFWFDPEEVPDIFNPGQANPGYKFLTGKDPRPCEPVEPVRIVQHHKKALKPKSELKLPAKDSQKQTESEQPAKSLPSFTPVKAIIQSRKLDKFKEQEIIQEIASLMQNGRSLSDACTIVWRVANNEGYLIPFKTVEDVWRSSAMSQFVHFLGDAGFS